MCVYFRYLVTMFSGLNQFLHKPIVHSGLLYGIVNLPQYSCSSPSAIFMAPLLSVIADNNTARTISAKKPFSFGFHLCSRTPDLPFSWLVCLTYQS